MYTVRIFETIDCSRDTIIESDIFSDVFEMFGHLFMRRQLAHHDIEVYDNDTLFYIGHVSDFLYYMLENFNEALDKEMDR